LCLRVGWHPVLGDMDGGAEVTIYVDGKPIPAREGEPIAAALYASGIKITRYSRHYGEPRGPFCMIGRCTECSMTVDGVPNVRTCLTAVSGGMRIETPGKASK
jgi:predicted molibdopterin-dependent oxidoreductase YjgC